MCYIVSVQQVVVIVNFEKATKMGSEDGEAFSNGSYSGEEGRRSII